MPKLTIPATDEDCALWRKIVTTTRGDTIESVTANMKYRLKRRFYVENDKLMCLAKKRPVLVASHLPELLKQYHDESGHPGRISTTKKVEQVYASIPEVFVRDYIANCSVCIAKRPPGVKPVTLSACSTSVASPSADVWTRVGIELLDMCRYPNEEGFRWILLATDHASRYMYAVPLKTKAGLEVVSALKDMFYQFGPPKILLHERGGEFVGIGSRIRCMLAASFPMVKVTQNKCKIPGGSSRTACANLHKQLSVWIAKNSEKPHWASALPMIIEKKNKEFTKANGVNITPFRLFFSREK